MKQTGRNILTLAIVMVISLMIGYFYSRNRIPDPTTITEYVTDTIYSKVPYEVPVPYGIEVDPITKVIYRTDTLWDDAKLAYLKDSLKLIISSLEGKIEIKDSYLKQHPYCHKLINLDLSYHELRMTLLNIEGEIFEDNYPLDLLNNNYRYQLNCFSAEKLKNPIGSLSFWEKLKPELFVGAKYDLVSNSFFISSWASKDIGRVNLSLDAHLNVFADPPTALLLGIGYKLGKE